MSTDSSPESIQIQLGQNTIKFLQFRKSKSSGDLYGWFGIPNVGLHISGHRPRPPLHPYIHLHLRSDPLNIHEDIIDLNPNDLRSCFQDFAKEFIDNISEPEPNESITMLPLPANSFSSGIIHILNLIQLMTGTYYRTKANRLPRLLADKPFLRGTIGLSNDSIILPFDKDTICEIPFKPNFDYFNRYFLGKPLNSLIDPFTKALETIQRNSPDSITKWIPPSTIGSFVQETQALIKRSKPQIIDY